MENNIKYILGGIAVVILVALILLNGTSGGSPSKVGEDTLEFIRENLAGPDIEFILTNTKKMSGMYEVSFEVLGQEDKAYVTEDGRYLFIQTRPIDMKPEEVKPESKPKAEIPDVDLFVMSYCPFGNQAEEILMPVADLLGDKANIELHYILYSDYATGYPDYCYDEENVYCSMHGIQELNQGIRELCVQKYQPEKLWDFVKAANVQATYENIDELWEGIANSVSVNVEQVKTCFNNEIEDILASELALTTQYGVQGSPTMVINGSTYDGGRSVSAYQEGICAGFKNVPDECNIQLEDTASTPNGSCE